MHWIPTGEVKIVKNDGQSWHRQTCLVQNLESHFSGPAVYFISARKSKEALSPAEGRLQNALSTRFAIPKWLWHAKEQDYNGYFYAARLPLADPWLRKHVTVFRFMVKYVTGSKQKEPGLMPDISYDWHILTFVTHYCNSDPSKAALLCFNVPDSLQHAIHLSITSMSAAEVSAHPFSLHAAMLEHVVELYDLAIWQFRDFVRGAEQQRPTIENPKPDYVAMHELARHVMHCSEVLATSLNVITHMLDELARWHSDQVCSLGSNATDPGAVIRHQKSMLQFMHNRSLALESRLTNEINLAFHITAHYANLISAQIAQATQIDSSATKTISILGLLFLPGTFISAVFSTSFFNFTPASDTQPAKWSLSDKFWVYWVVAIPVTAITVAIWFWWQKTLVPSHNNAGTRKKNGSSSKTNTGLELSLLNGVSNKV